MSERLRRLSLASVLGLIASSAAAQTPIIYPAKNQTPQQQQKDVGECAAWAQQTTGVDPVALASLPATVAPPPTAAPSTAPTGPSGERVRGALRGAAAGAVIGEVANNDADHGAAVGATAGALAGGSRARRERREGEIEAEQKKEQAAEQQKAAQREADAKKQEQLATYKRANAACMEGRGYVLK
jgi:hypothetical protein